jgi:hypothetical protein
MTRPAPRDLVKRAQAVRDVAVERAMDAAEQRVLDVFDTLSPGQHGAYAALVGLEMSGSISYDVFWRGVEELAPRLAEAMRLTDH